MSYIQSISSEQTWLLPYSLDELVEENNPVRAYVDSLSMEALGFARAVPAQTGRPAYDPRDLLKDNMDILDDAPSVYYPIVCAGLSDEQIRVMADNVRI